jgi:curved DNA-binding protein
MSDDGGFIDYYDALGVGPDCSPKALEKAYRDRAKLYHPDHSGSADVSKFKEVVEAYKALRHPDERARYDAAYFANERPEAAESPPAGEGAGEEKAALDDAEAHSRMLLQLYKQRRERAQDAGVPEFAILDALGCSEAHLEFHLWYLRAKGFIERNEQGMYAITIEGVDHVIAMSQTTKLERLLIAQATDRGDGFQARPE